MITSFDIRRWSQMTAVPSGLGASQEQAALVKTAVPEAVYDPVSRILKVEPAGGYRGRWWCCCRLQRRYCRHTGCRGGCADCRAYFGAEVLRVYDRREWYPQTSVKSWYNTQRWCRCWLRAWKVRCRQYSVDSVKLSNRKCPTSVSYGANFHGLSALITMINSCANGISVVNIDSRYGAGISLRG